MYYGYKKWITTAFLAQNSSLRLKKVAIFLCKTEKIKNRMGTVLAKNFFEELSKNVMNRVTSKNFFSTIGNIRIRIPNTLFYTI